MARIVAVYQAHAPDCPTPGPRCPCEPVQFVVDTTYVAPATRDMRTQISRARRVADREAARTATRIFWSDRP